MYVLFNFGSYPVITFIVYNTLLIILLFTTVIVLLPFIIFLATVDELPYTIPLFNIHLLGITLYICLNIVLLKYF